MAEQSNPLTISQRPAFPPRLLLLGAAAGFLLTLFEMDALEWTFARIAVPHRWYFGILLASFLGSLINIPLARTAPRADGKSTIIALNVGGALVPVGLSTHLLFVQHGLLQPALLALAVVIAATYATARPVPGVGIAMPLFLAPVLAAVSAWLLVPDAPTAVAYVAGSIGTLVGADLLNLRRLGTLGAPVVSIGGAGTFDGIFLSGLLAALLA